MSDNYTRSGAQYLANLIESYWTSRGYPQIVATAYPIPDMPGLHGVRTNIGPNGFPPRG